ncbi:MAG: hypothetical protein OEY06_06915 [Gammaproteobacteria bacterium]|nr:hypothetical protein [Gammaproteobacteria bacterium]
MNKLKLLIPLLIVLLNSGCASFGPTVRIETPEPAEDFVVVCGWYSGAGFFHGSGSEQSHKVLIANSGEVVECGLGFEADNQVQVMHPVYWDGTKTVEEGITVYRYTGTKLDYLDKQKEKFEAGFWDNHRNPGFEYANDIVRCGFPHQYFEYYSEVKKVDKDHFKRLYHESMLECNKRILPILNKYSAHTYSGSRPNVEESMNNLWESEGWDKYK